MSVKNSEAEFMIELKRASTIRSSVREIGSPQKEGLEYTEKINSRPHKMRPTLPASMDNWIKGKDKSKRGIMQAIAYSIGRSAKISPKTKADRFIEFQHVRKKKISTNNSPTKKKLKPNRKIQPKSIFNKTQKKNKLKRTGTSLDLELKTTSCLILLDSGFKQIWEVLKFIMLTYQFYYLPLSMTFLIEGVPIWLYLIDKAIDLFFLSDIILTFFTVIIVNYDIETSYKSIAKNYLTGWFLTDILSVLPIDELISLFTGESASDYSKIGRSLKALRFIRFARMAKFLKLFKNFNFNDSSNMFASVMYKYFGNSVFLTILPNFLVMLTLSHFFCCLWYGLALYEETDLNWVYFNGFENKDMLTTYIISLYSTIQTFSSTGYGDTLVTTNAELAFRIMILIFGTLVYTLFSGQIMDHRFKSIEREEKVFLKLRALDDIKKIVELSDLIYYYAVEELQSGMKEEVKMKYNLSLLSQEDRSSFLYRKYLNKFKDIRLFSAKLNSRSFILDLGNSLKKNVYEEGEVIYTSHNQAALFYIILNGTANVMLRSCDSIPIIELSKTYFGEYEIIFSKTRQFTVIAKTVCDVYYLQAADFKRIFLHQDELLADSIISYSQLRRDLWVNLDNEFTNLLTRKIFWRLIFKQFKQKKTGNKFKESWLRNTDRLEDINGVDGIKKGVPQHQISDRQ